MKLRDPRRQPNTELKALSPPHPWKSYKVTLLTPMYGGGVSAGEIDALKPVRESAIRGQLRYWWRFINQTKYPDGQELFAKEREIWGGMSEDDEDYASQVRIRIADLTPNQPTPTPCAEYVKNKKGKYNAKFKHRIKQYVMFPGQGKSPKSGESRPEKMPDDVMTLPLTFTLIVNCDEKLFQQSVLEAIEWWGNFGGLGARTRRGMGSIELVDQATKEPLKTLTDEDVKDKGCRLYLLKKTSDAITSWNNSVGLLEQFRQGKNIGRRFKYVDDAEGNKKSKFGTSFWPEPDSIRIITNIYLSKHKPDPKLKTRKSFPRAAFGLPIIFDFKSDQDKPNKTELKPVNSERMASPIILKAQSMGNGLYKPALLMMPTCHLESLQVELGYVGKEEKLTGMPDKFWHPGKAKHVSPINNQKGADTPIEAFISFFQNNGKNKEENV